MNFKLVYTCVVYLFSLSLYAQSGQINDILNQVEQNNKDLIALKELHQSQILDLKSENNLENPEILGYYMPFGEHNTGVYTEFEISQSFEFPTVYAMQRKLGVSKQMQIEAQYNQERIRVLTKASLQCNELIFLNKVIKVLEKRLEQVQLVLDQSNKKYESGQVSILELNKAKLAYLQEEYKLKQAMLEKQNALNELKSLNGGIELTFDQINDKEVQSLDKDSLWRQKLALDPTLKILQAKEASTQNNLSLTKQQSLPDFSAGYNYQGVSGANYSGVYARLTIPLWNNRYKVKAAKAKLNYTQLLISSETKNLYQEFENEFNEYQLLQEKVERYKQTLASISDESLLLKSYQLGELSFIEYYNELKFYREAQDTLLDMEKQLNQLKLKLLNHTF